jgi:hypothetical protein
MTDVRSRAVIVVFDGHCSDTEAALVRNGLRMFRGVEKVLPVRGVPNDRQARDALARSDLLDKLRAAEAELVEARARLELATQATTGPMPVASALDDGTIEWKPAS